MRLRAIPVVLALATMVVACTSGDGADPEAGGTAAAPAQPAPSATGAASEERASGGTPSTGRTTNTPSHAAPTVTSTATTAVVGQPGPDVGDPYFPALGNTGIDTLHYELDLVYDPASFRLDGVARIDVVAEIDLASFDLDLVGLDVGAASVDGVAVPFVVTADEVQIALAEAVEAGTELQVEIAYGGVVAPSASTAQGFEVGWVTRPWGAFVVAEPDGARNWFPADDHPTDKATYTVAVTVPAAHTVAATGLLTGVEDATGGRRRWVYEARDPVASYLVSVAVGDFTLTDPVPADPAAGGPGSAGSSAGALIRHALAPGTAGLDALGQTAAMLGFLAGVFGPYPFEVYGVLAVPEPLGYALENQTLTLVGQDFLGSPDFAPVVLLHELAHQWAGNHLAVHRWSDIWLNEGFATYAEWLWQEHTGGPSVDALAAGALEEAVAGQLGPPLDPGPDGMFSRTVYVRGALALHALRGAVGAEVFSTIVRAWFERFGGGSASTIDFLALVTELGGAAAASTVESWLTAPAVPAA